MPVIQFAPFAFPRQIEGFPATKGKDGPKFERSCEGALHLRPGATAELTDDELEFIGKEHPEVRKVIRVVAPNQDKKAEKAPDLVAQAQAQSSQPAPEAAPTAPEPTPEPETDAKPKKK